MPGLTIEEANLIHEATSAECSNLFVHLITDKEYQFRFERTMGKIVAEDPDEEYLTLIMFDTISDEENEEFSKMITENPILERPIRQIQHVNERMIHFAYNLTNFLDNFQKTFNKYVKDVDAKLENPSDIFLKSVFDALLLAYETLSNNAYTAFALSARKSYQDIEMCSISECRAELIRSQRSQFENEIRRPTQENETKKLEKKVVDLKNEVKELKREKNETKKLEKNITDLESEVKRLRQEKEDLKKQKKASDKAAKAQEQRIAELELKSAVFEKPQTRGRKKMRSDISRVGLDRYFSLPPLRKGDYYSFDDKTYKSLSEFSTINKQNMTSLRLD